MVRQSRVRAVCLTLKVLRSVLLPALPLSVGVLWTTAPQPPDPAATPDTQPRPEDQVRQLDRHDLAWYAPLWERDLKQPPIPSAPPQPPAERSADRGPLPKLLATLVEPQARFAHLMDGSGKVQMKGIDETIDRFRVRSIEPGRVELQDGGRSVWLEIPRPAGKK